jgi:hypothetical protein
MTEPNIRNLDELFNKNPDTNYGYEIPFIVSNENQELFEKPSLSQSVIMSHARGDNRAIVKNDIIFVAYDVGFETTSKNTILNQIFNYKICDHVSNIIKTTQFVYVYSAPSRTSENKINCSVPKILIEKDNTNTVKHIYSGANKKNDENVKVYDFIASNLVLMMHNSISYDNSFYKNDSQKEGYRKGVCTFTDPILQGYRFDTSVIKEDNLRIVYITLYKVDNDRVNATFKDHLMKKGDEYYGIKIKITPYHPKNTFTTQEFFLPPTLFRLGSYNVNDKSFKLNCKHVLDYIGLVFFLPIVKAENIYETVNNTYKQPNPYHLDPLTTPAGNIYKLPNPPTNPPANPPTNPGYSQVLPFKRPPLNPNDLYAQPINALQPPEKPKYTDTAVIKPSTGTKTNEPPQLPPRMHSQQIQSSTPQQPRNERQLEQLEQQYARVNKPPENANAVGGSYKPRKTKKHYRTHPKTHSRTHSRTHSKSTHKHVKNTVKK